MLQRAFPKYWLPCVSVMLVTSVGGIVELRSHLREAPLFQVRVLLHSSLAASTNFRLLYQNWSNSGPCLNETVITIYHISEKRLTIAFRILVYATTCRPRQGPWLTILNISLRAVYLTKCSHMEVGGSFGIYLYHCLKNSSYCSATQAPLNVPWWELNLEML